MTLPNKALLEVRRDIDAGRLDAAEENCRHIVQSVPQQSEAWNLLGWIQCQQGNLSEAIDAIRKAIAIHPDDAELHRNLGYVHAANVDFESAIECYRHALTLNPEDVDAHNSLGVALKQSGQLDLAAEHLREALRLRPDIPTLYQNLAEILRLQGTLDEATKLYEQAVQIAPNNAAFKNGLGILLQLDGKLKQAIARFQEALVLEPDHPLYAHNLAEAQKAFRTDEAAIVHCRDILRSMPDSVEAHLNMGDVYLAQNDVQQAATHFGRAVALQPGNALAHNKLASTLIDLGDFDAAKTHLEEAVRLHPEFAEAYFNLSDLVIQGKYCFSAQMLAKIESLLSGGRVPLKAASIMHFALGNNLDKQGKYDEAFCAFHTGNQIQQKLGEEFGILFDLELHRRNTDECIAFFDASYFDKPPPGGVDSELPIFVIGMPRCGSTLVEQIIASHPNAATAGELPEIGRLVQELSKTHHHDDAFPHCLSNVDAQTIHDLASQYLSNLSKHGKDSTRIVDKALSNFFYLGFLFTLLPKSRIIHCRRDPMDIGLSCYFRRFGSVNWSWSLESIGAYYREYNRLMEHWSKVFPSQIYDLHYEKLIADPETMSRELIHFCGLSWSDRCLEFYKNRDAVKTSSRIQVREPIYKTSSGRWKNYAAHLEPYKKAIEGSDNPPII